MIQGLLETFEAGSDIENEIKKIVEKVGIHGCDEFDIEEIRAMILQKNKNRQKVGPTIRGFGQFKYYENKESLNMKTVNSPKKEKIG